MTGGLYLYVIRFGDRTKVGVSTNIARRLTDHRRAARAAGVRYEHILTLEPHAEARRNEATLVRQFSADGSEYLTADADQVVHVVQALPMTPLPVGAAVERADVPESTNISSTIRAELARRNLTAESAQSAIGIGPRTWMDRMRQPGDWRLGQLAALAEWMGMDVTELVDR